MNLHIIFSINQFIICSIKCTKNSEKLFVMCNQESSYLFWDVWKNVLPTWNQIQNETSVFFPAIIFFFFSLTASNIQNESKCSGKVQQYVNFPKISTYSLPSPYKLISLPASIFLSSSLALWKSLDMMKLFSLKPLWEKKLPLGLDRHRCCSETVGKTRPPSLSLFIPWLQSPLWQ